jgi:hypothetical protein
MHLNLPEFTLRILCENRPSCHLPMRLASKVVKKTQKVIILLSLFKFVAHFVAEGEQWPENILQPDHANSTPTGVSYDRSRSLQ